MTGKSRGFTMVPYTFVRYQSFTEAAELSVRKYPPPNIEWPLLELWLSSRSINLKWCDILQFSCLVSCIAHVRNLLRKKTCQHCKIEIKTQNWNWRKKTKQWKTSLPLLFDHQKNRKTSPKNICLRKNSEENKNKMKNMWETEKNLKNVKQSRENFLCRKFRNVVFKLLENIRQYWWGF